MGTDKMNDTWHWTANDILDDYTARIGDYTLRVEQMNRKRWWWCVYYKTDQVERGEERVKIEAMKAAVLAYMEQIRTVTIIETLAK